MKFVGPSGLYLYMAIVSVIVGAIGTYRKKYRLPIPIEQQAVYRSIPRTTPIVSELDPRAESEPEAPKIITDDELEDVDNQSLSDKISEKSPANESPSSS